MRLLFVLTVVGAAAFAAPALADPCKAVPDRGPTPEALKPGRVFSGTVRYIGDGDSLCIGRSPDPGTWIEVRLADFNAPELRERDGPQAKAVLSRIAMGRTLVCRADHRTYDRIAARCTLNGRPLGDLLRAAGVREGGR